MMAGCDAPKVTSAANPDVQADTVAGQADRADVQQGGDVAVPGVGNGSKPWPCKADADCIELEHGPCAIAKCGNHGCEFMALPDQASCTDGEPCTADTVCLEGQCSGGTDTCGTCEVDADCKPLGAGHACNALFQCVNVQTSAGSVKGCRKMPEKSADWLPLCLPGCPDAGAPVLHCDWQSMACVAGNHVAPGTCDDGNPCTLQDKCGGGSCIGIANLCLDGAACSTDTCDVKTGGCTNVANSSVCAVDRQCVLASGCVAPMACPAGQVAIGEPPVCTVTAVQPLDTEHKFRLANDVGGGLALAIASGGSGGCAKTFQVRRHDSAGQFVGVGLEVSATVACAPVADDMVLDGSGERLGVVWSVSYSLSKLAILGAAGSVGAPVDIAMATSGDKRLLPRKGGGWWLVQYDKTASRIAMLPLGKDGVASGPAIELVKGSSVPSLAPAPDGKILMVVAHVAGYTLRWLSASGTALEPAWELSDIAFWPEANKTVGAAVDADGLGATLAIGMKSGAVRVVRLAQGGPQTVVDSLVTNAYSPPALVARPVGTALLTPTWMGAGHQLPVWSLTATGKPSGALLRVDTEPVSVQGWSAVALAGDRLAVAWRSDSANGKPGPAFLRIVGL